MLLTSPKILSSSLRPLKRVGRVTQFMNETVEDPRSYVSWPHMGICHGAQIWIQIFLSAKFIHGLYCLSCETNQFFLLVFHSCNQLINSSFMDSSFQHSAIIHQPNRNVLGTALRVTEMKKINKIPALTELPAQGWHSSERHGNNYFMLW